MSKPLPALLCVLPLLGACAPLPDPGPVPVPSDWVEVGAHRLPAQVFDSSQQPAHPEPIVWEDEPVVWVWEMGWPGYQGFALPAGADPVDVAFLDVGGRVHTLKEGVGCASSHPCEISSSWPASSVVVMGAGMAGQLGLRRASLVRVVRSDRVVEVQALGLVPAGP